MNFDKTTRKQTFKSEKYEESTVKPGEPKYKSQKVPETTSFYKDGKRVVFNVYHDARVGIYQEDLPTMHMEVDEDQETTSSVKKQGEKICILDLKESLKIPREQTQMEDSYTTYEDSN